MLSVRCSKTRQKNLMHKQVLMEGPKLGFEPRQKAPQASRLPGYLTSATNLVTLATLYHHLRFLRNIKLSFWQTNSKPASSSLLISSDFSTTLTVNSSLFDSNIVSAMLM